MEIPGRCVAWCVFLSQWYLKDAAAFNIRFNLIFIISQNLCDSKKAEIASNVPARRNVSKQETHRF